MGFIDSKFINLACSACGKMETVRVLQYGSAYGASWQSLPAFSMFTVLKTASDALSGPYISASVCKACGAPAQMAETW